MQYLAENDDLSEVCVSKSRLLTFLGNEFGELLMSFCVDRSIGTVCHTTKADILYNLIPSMLIAASQAYHTNLFKPSSAWINHQKSESRRGKWKRRKWKIGTESWNGKLERKAETEKLKPGNGRQQLRMRNHWHTNSWKRKDGAGVWKLIFFNPGVTVFICIVCTKIFSCSYILFFL